MNDKKLEKIEKILGRDTVEEMNSLDHVAVKEKIVSANSAIKQAIDELEANPEYQHIKEQLKAVSEGMKEVKKRQNAVIQYGLYLLLLDGLHKG